MREINEKNFQEITESIVAFKTLRALVDYQLEELEEQEYLWAKSSMEEILKNYKILDFLKQPVQEFFIENKVAYEKLHSRMLEDGIAYFDENGKRCIDTEEQLFAMMTRYHAYELEQQTYFDALFVRLKSRFVIELEKKYKFTIESNEFLEGLLNNTDSTETEGGKENV